MYDTEMFETVLGAAVGVLVIILIAFLVFYVIGLWKLFKKAGKQGWEAIIPYYNTWTLVEIVGLKWWWFLIAIVSSIISLLGLDNLSFIGTIASLVANINIYYNLSKIFNKSTGWIVLSVFFGWVTIPLLGYSNSEVWNAEARVTPNGLFDANSSTSTTNASDASEAQTGNSDNTNNQ